MTQASKPLPPSLAKELAQIAREARVELFGPDGIPEWGTKFVDIERQALDVGHDQSAADFFPSGQSAGT